MGKSRAQMTTAGYCPGGSYSPRVPVSEARGSATCLAGVPSTAAERTMRSLEMPIIRSKLLPSPRYTSSAALIRLKS